MGENMMGGWSLGAGLFGMLMLFFWILIIIGIVFLIKWIVNQSSGGQGGTTYQSPESALEILKKRYARGEIDKQEFEEKKKDLS